MVVETGIKYFCLERGKAFLSGWHVSWVLGNMCADLNNGGCGRGKGVHQVGNPVEALLVNRL